MRQPISSTLQKNYQAQYVVTPASQTTELPLITTALGAFWTANSVATFVPTTAARISLQTSLNYTANNDTNFAAVAPNNNYGTILANSPYPLSGFHISTGTNVGTFVVNQTFEMALESANIYTGASIAGGAAAVSCFGWTDNI